MTAVLERCGVSAESDPIKWPVPQRKGFRNPLAAGKFSLISSFFFKYQFIVWPNLGLHFVSAKLCLELVLASRDLRPLAILL